MSIEPRTLLKDAGRWALYFTCEAWRSAGGRLAELENSWSHRPRSTFAVPLDGEPDLLVDPLWALGSRGPRSSGKLLFPGAESSRVDADLEAWSRYLLDPRGEGGEHLSQTETVRYQMAVAWRMLQTLRRLPGSATPRCVDAVALDAARRLRALPRWLSGLSLFVGETIKQVRDPSDALVATLALLQAEADPEDLLASHTLRRVERARSTDEPDAPPEIDLVIALHAWRHQREVDQADVHGLRAATRHRAAAAFEKLARSDRRRMEGIRWLLPVRMMEGPIARSAGEKGPYGALRARLKSYVRVSQRPLILAGPSGVGKTHLARFVNDVSPRTGPFVALNCHAIPSALIESELFGHEKGAFTGAVQRQGLLRRADGGTLFLDEIGDASLAFQAKLLKALDERQARAVGSERTYRFDVRFVFATRFDLGLRVADGLFREDLLYRMGQPFAVPGLRAWGLDGFGELARVIHRKISGELRVEPARRPALDDALIAALYERCETLFPGEIRQLESEMCAACIEAIQAGEGRLALRHFGSTTAAWRQQPRARPLKPAARRRAYRAAARQNLGLDETMRACGYDAADSRDRKRFHEWKSKNRERLAVDDDREDET